MGNPAYFSENDCFYDLRDMIKKMMVRIKKINQGKKFTIIYDRGGFSFEICKYIEVRGNYFITWEKGFKSETVEISFFDNAKEMVIKRPRNEVGKFKEYKVKYYSEEYKLEEEYNWKRIIILREDGGKISSIITNDNKRQEEEVIEKILNRFLQENDFKKIKGYFGFDEITSYRKLTYNELGDKEKSKEITTEKYKEIQRKILKLKNKRKAIFTEIGAKIFKHADIERVNKKFKIKYRKKIKEIIEINKDIKKKQLEKGKTKKDMSKLEKCILDGKEEIDLRPKYIMGILKICARNIFVSGAKEFLKDYPNLRNYQKVFRQLIRSAGKMIYNGDLITIKIKNFGPNRLKEKLEHFLDRINSKNPMLLDGKHKLRFSIL